MEVNLSYSLSASVIRDDNGELIVLTNDVTEQITLKMAAQSPDELFGKSVIEFVIKLITK